MQNYYRKKKFAGFISRQDAGNDFLFLQSCSLDTTFGGENHELHGYHNDSAYRVYTNITNHSLILTELGDTVVQGRL